MYASHPPLPATTQHSLPGARYGLPGPVFHRLDRASFPGAQAIQGREKERLDCFVAEPVIGLAEGETRWLLAMTGESYSVGPANRIRLSSTSLMMKFVAPQGWRFSV